MKQRQIDWKAVAARRLDAIRCHKRQEAIMRKRASDYIESEMLVVFHARCVQRSEYESVVRDMAESVARRLYP